jgi:hypothetical protein
MRLLAAHSPATPAWERTAAAAVVGFAFLLDPEAQHFAAGGFTEMPFTLGLTVALAGLATGWAARRPLLFGLLLGVAGSFRANMLWLAPLLALGSAALPATRPRWRTFALVLAGFALPLAPWWLYKWRVFGTPGWDLTRLVLWDGVEGRTWLSLLHRPEMPAVPAGGRAFLLLADKAWTNLQPLLLALARGPRPLWIGALAVWLFTRPPRPLAVTGAITLVQGALGLGAAAVAIPWLRYLFPARVPVEAAGLLAVWALLGRVPTLSPAAIRFARVAVAALALFWGARQTTQGLAEARVAAGERGLPATATLEDLASRLARELPQDEPVMSNLGPSLAWYGRRPVVHLALTPEDVEACRARLPLRHVLVAFRDRSTVWPGWEDLATVAGSERGHPEWNVLHARRWRTPDGFTIAWLELGPPRPQLAAVTR